MPPAPPTIPGSPDKPINHFTGAPDTGKPDGRPTVPGAPDPGRPDDKPMTGKPVPGALTLTLVNKLPGKISVLAVLAGGKSIVIAPAAGPLEIAPGATVQAAFKCEDLRLTEAKDCQWTLKISGPGLPASRSMSGQLAKSGRRIEITAEALGVKKGR